MADTEAAAGGMRLDRFLWFARIVRTRSVAQDLAGSGRLRLDGRVIDRAAATVRIGTVIAFAAPGGRVRALRVALLPARRGPPAEGRACYVDLLGMEPAAAPGD